MTLLAKRPENVVVKHYSGANERVHQNLPDYLLTGFADPWMRLASKGPVVPG